MNEGRRGGGVKRDEEIGNILLAFSIWHGSVQRQKREFCSMAPPNARLARTFFPEGINDVGNYPVP